MLDKSKKLDINQITGTKDRAKQAEILLGTVGAPVVDLVIRYDGRTNQIAITTIGGDIPIQAAYTLLDKAREILHQREIEALAKKDEPQIPTKEE